MIFLKVLGCSLIFIAAALFIDEHMSLPKLDILYPQHYNIQFILNPNYTFQGEYNVSIYIPYETQNIYVYMENLIITQVRVTNYTQISKKKKGSYSSEEFIYNNKTFITTICFPYNLSLGFYILNLNFMGLFKNGGFRTPYINQQNNKVLLVATHYHKFMIRRLFPLLKDAVYASYNISIKYHKYLGYTALSNMPVQKVNVDENNMQWTNFKITPLMPVYLLAMGLVRLIFISDRKTKLLYRSNMLRRMNFAYTVATDTVRFLEKKFYIRKFPEINHIPIPELFDIEEIMLGFVLHREEDILFKETDSELRKIEIARIIGYKVTHEWLYNVIDPYKWESWLSKGFATFFGIYVVDKRFPNFGILDYFVIQMQYDFLHWSTKDTWPLKSEFNSSLVEIPRYIKASIMFRTLQIFSEEIFWKVIEVYFTNYCYTSSSDFWSEMQAIMHASSLKMKYKLEDKIINWTQLNHYPVINVQRNYEENSLNISVKDFNADIWMLNIVTQTGLKNVLSVVWLESRTLYHSTTDLIDENDWILVNSSQSGCYRVNYDVENWSRLAKYLNTTDFFNIPLFDRVKIVDDAFHFLMTGQLNFTIFSNISKYLYKELNYISWYPIFKILESISGFFAFPESEPMKQYMEFELPLNKILWKIKYPDFRPSEFSNLGDISTRYLREEATRWLCFIGHDHCLFTANNELNLYLYNHNNSLPDDIWMGWKEWTLCNGLKTADNDTWTNMFQIYWQESDNSVLKFLPCTQDVDTIARYIQMMRIGVYFEKVTVLDYINAFISVIARHAKNNSVLEKILNQLENLRRPVIKQLSIAAQLTMLINHVYSMEQLNEIKKYVEEKFKGFSVFSLISHVEVLQKPDGMREYMELEKKNKEDVIICVNRKLELRWNQIKTRLMEFRYLANLDDILRNNITFG